MRGAVRATLSGKHVICSITRAPPLVCWPFKTLSGGRGGGTRQRSDRARAWGDSHSKRSGAGAAVRHRGWAVGTGGARSAHHRAGGWSIGQVLHGHPLTRAHHVRSNPTSGLAVSHPRTPLPPNPKQAETRSHPFNTRYWLEHLMLCWVTPGRGWRWCARRSEGAFMFEPG